MENKIKILIVSNTPWDDANSFGSSFSNIFGGNENFEIANIYCQPGLPCTNVASKFFRISERGICKSLIRRNIESGEEVKNTPDVRNLDSKAVQRAKQIRWQIMFWARDLIWATGKWHSKTLDEFIDSFAPDLVFQPVYFQPHINRIGVYAAKRAGVPMIGYTSDDNYTLRQYSWSPLYWIDRLIKRRSFKNVVDKCKFLYVITEKQRVEYDGYFGQGKCKVLYKGADFSKEVCLKQSSDSVLSLVYTGNIGMGRWKILASIAKELQFINRNGQKAELKIYSATAISPEMDRKLNLVGTSKLMGKVPGSMIPKIQSDADILVYTEPFEKSERYKARLSFSTKIVDYLSSGRCILAAGWKECGGIDYLIRNNAAQVVTDLSQMRQAIEAVIASEKLRNEIASRAYECGRKYHQIERIRDGLYRDIIATLKDNN